MERKCDRERTGVFQSYRSQRPNVLEFCGVPFYFSEEEQCYRVRSDYRFPTLMLTNEEALGQAVATAISKAPGLDIGLGASPTQRGSLLLPKMKPNRSSQTP